MLCPKCGADYHQMGVIETRPLDGWVRRRRKCYSCGNKFTTYEIPEVEMGRYQKAERFQQKMMNAMSKED